VRFHSIAIDKECVFEFSGNSNEIKEFFSILEEKIVREGEVDKDILFVKTSKLKFYFDGKSLWFYFIKRPYFYLQDRVCEKNYECWFRVTEK
jgi:hypothetical protein